MHFPHIARLTERLGVTPFVRASAHNWDDVIEHQFFRTSAPFAAFCFPFPAAGWRKIPSVSLKFPCFVVSQMIQRGKHFISASCPPFFKGNTHLGSSFWRLFVPVQLLTAFFSASSAFAYLNPVYGFGVVSLSPKGIIRAADSLTPTFWIFAAHSRMPSFEIVAGDVKKSSTDKAWNILTCSDIWHGNSDNGVKSVETPLYVFRVSGAIPSQAAQECVEGVTTRAWSPDRTVKPHERAARKGRDSLSYTATYRSADKEPHDNSTDETLNVGENSPISAAQFPIAQYYASVTMSGLQMLQNSGKEQIIDLMEGRIRVAEAQLMNRIDYDLYQDGTGNGGKNLIGLAAAVPDAPSSGTYGGIDRGTWNFWRSQKYAGVADGGAAVSAANIQQYMTTLGLRLVRGSDMPDLWIADATYYGLYVNSLQAIQRISSETGSGTAGAGFPSLKFYGGGMAADVVMGGGVNGAVNTAGTAGGATSAHMWALNTKYIFFRPHADRNFVPIGGERQAVNQDAIVKLQGWAGNLTCSGSQFQGVLIA